MFNNKTPLETLPHDQLVELASLKWQELAEDASQESQATALLSLQELRESAGDDDWVLIAFLSTDYTSVL